MSDDAVLLRVFDAVDELTKGGRLTRWEEVVERTGLVDDDVQAALRKLHDRETISGRTVTGIDNPGGYELIDIRWRGKR